MLGCDFSTQFLRLDVGATQAVGSLPEDNSQQKLIVSDSCHVSHPRQGLDLLCVGDLADYYHDIKLTSNGSGISRNWQPNLIYSPEVFSGFGIQGPLVGAVNTWNEWFSVFW